MRVSTVHNPFNVTATQYQRHTMRNTWLIISVFKQLKKNLDELWFGWYEVYDISSNILAKIQLLAIECPVNRSNIFV